MKHLALVIPGIKAGEAPHTTEVRSPYDNTLLANVEQADDRIIDHALDNAANLFRNRNNWLTSAQRIEILTKLADLMQRERDSLALNAAREGGKPFADSLVEVDRAVDGVKLAIITLRTQAGEEIPMNVNAASAHRLAFTRFEPIGPVVAFSAFNHPVNLIIHQVISAVAVGCPVIIKPAEATPISCWRIVEMLREAGLPEGWCQALLTTNHDVSAKLASDKRAALFSFIGSANVGWSLRSQLAPGTRCVLEHGGAAPVIVMADADVDDALPLITRGGFYHAGQVCVSVQRVFVEKSMARDFAQQLADRAGKLTVGDPTKKDTEVGPLIRADVLARLQEWIKEAIDGGAELLTGGSALDNQCFAPTVLFNPPDSARMSKEEVFGPVVCVYSFDTIDEAIARANDVPYAFQASVFTRAIDAALRAAQRLDAATVIVNDHTAFRVDWMPFAGLKHSGLGTGGIPYSMRDCQIEKLIVVRSKEL
jgi:acyl-CoA reductase-like NAD-dependent aldehyde dehydrogenase